MISSAMLTEAFLYAFMSQGLPVMREPQAPTTWTQSAKFVCDDERVEVVGYGAGRPLNGIAEITYNEVPLAGQNVTQLRHDLSNKRAAYRLAARCPQGEDSIILFIYLGEQTEGQVAYRAGHALMRSGRLERYEGLQTANQETFWFR